MSPWRLRTSISNGSTETSTISRMLLGTELGEIGRERARLPAENGAQRDRISAEARPVVMLEHRAHRFGLFAQGRGIDPRRLDLASKRLADQRGDLLPVEPAFRAQLECAVEQPVLRERDRRDLRDI